ncbi:pseudouridine synthase [Porphyromonas asaccharolytica]|uniref:Pseudouridine synthase n=1 Tax=Porphyromonas asaccharolytica (strain ATCC 25260 / DSM 20707 / BCRC 10618 / CCUG 7834 / JCM 6326 / LMG 13178 / VPI 4198 / B440) TaxID=879243 RepID=F4KM85_PORAD|nr:pseudouridine synthase [Porphyromonas asaccharolytica]AEE13251.1 pseudouridine synthase Rsu [Porphyromonas asaccharolytica DSM 20707]
MSIDSNPTSEAQHKKSPSADSSAEVPSSASTGKRKRQRIARPAVSESLIRVKVSGEESATVTHRNIDASEMVKPRDINAEKALERRHNFDDQHNEGRNFHKVSAPMSVVSEGNQDDPVIYPYAKQRGKATRPKAHSEEARTSSPRRKRGANTTDRKDKRSSAPRKNTGQRSNKQRKGEAKPRTPKAPVEPVRYASPLVEAGEPIRLNKFLSNSGLCSRRMADQYIAAGRVKVNGAVISELGSQVLPTDQVMVDDKLVSLEAKVYVLLNKPKNCVTTLTDPEGRRTVMDLVHNACTERIYPIGRLDRNTTGILLLTNDGDLAVRLMHPAFRKKKIYEVALDKEVTVEHMQMIAHGFELEDGEIHADAISYITGQTHDKVGIEIHSGRNRIVRRIFEHLGYRVVHLDRVYYAGLTKKDLPRGRWRYLTPEEVRYLRMGVKEQEDNGVAPTTKVYHKHQETPDHPFASEEIED